MHCIRILIAIVCLYTSAIHAFSSATPSPDKLLFLPGAENPTSPALKDYFSADAVAFQLHANAAALSNGNDGLTDVINELGDFFFDQNISISDIVNFERTLDNFVSSNSPFVAANAGARFAFDITPLGSAFSVHISYDDQFQFYQGLSSINGVNADQALIDFADLTTANAQVFLDSLTNDVALINILSRKRSLNASVSSYLTTHITSKKIGIALGGRLKLQELTIDSRIRDIRELIAINNEPFVLADALNLFPLSLENPNYLINADVGITLYDRNYHLSLYALDALPQTVDIPSYASNATSDNLTVARIYDTERGNFFIDTKMRVELGYLSDSRRYRFSIVHDLNSWRDGLNNFFAIHQITTIQAEIASTLWNSNKRAKFGYPSPKVRLALYQDTAVDEQWVNFGFSLWFFDLNALFNTGAPGISASGSSLSEDATIIRGFTIGVQQQF